MTSAQEQHQLATPYGTTAAPPPTPSTQPNNLIATSAAADSLSRLLHRLPPTLSMPTRRSSQTTVSPPIISLSDPKPSLLTNLLSASQLGFFQLTNHSIPTELSQAAHSESLSLFDLPRDQKQLHFPQNWPIGYDDGDEEDENETGGCGSFCLDSQSLTQPTELSLTSLNEFTREMEKLGLELVQLLSCAFGFDNPFRNDPSRVCSLMWISEASAGNKPVTSGKFYPYVVGLQYQIRSQKSSMLADSGWVSVSPEVGSVLVTLGDIAQVWSNGKSKKVRGRPMACLGDSSNSQSISMSLLVTLPLDSTISPLLPTMVVAGDGDDEVNNDEQGIPDMEEESVFNSFSLEDYAWRVYHERLLHKDTLDRYRT